MFEDWKLPFGARVTVHATVARIISEGYGHTILRDRRDLLRGHGARGTLFEGWPGDPIPADDDYDQRHGLETALPARIRLRRIPLDQPEAGVFLGRCVRMEGIYHPPVAGYSGMDGWKEGDPGELSVSRRVRLYEVALPPAYDHLPYRSVLVWPGDLEPV